MSHSCVHVEKWYFGATSSPFCAMHLCVWWRRARSIIVAASCSTYMVWWPWMLQVESGEGEKGPGEAFVWARWPRVTPTELRHYIVGQALCHQSTQATTEYPPAILSKQSDLWTYSERFFNNTFHPEQSIRTLDILWKVLNVCQPE